MEELLQTILEMEHPLIILIIMWIAFCPSSVVICLRKVNHWVKTITVLAFGELAAILLTVLSLAAKSADVGGLLPHCTILAIVMAVMILAFAAFGHMQKWKLIDRKNWQSGQKT